jgi:C4-dicarboxylate transporter
MEPRGALASVARVLVRCTLAVTVLGSLVGCGTHGEGDAATRTPRPAATPGAVAPSGSPVITPFPSDPFGSPATPLSPVAGVVTAIEPAGSATPTGMTLRSTSGVTITFVIGQIDDLADFPLSDLADDIDSQVSVLVYFKPQGADLVVYHLENAP